MLYRYTHWDENTKNSLEDRYFWFSKPKNFNDPFDCNMDRLLASKFARENLKIEELKSLTNNFGILCFTKKTDPNNVGDKGYNNLHFWSHYAHFHMGISLGYEESEIKSYYSQKIMCDAELNKVTYKDIRNLDNYQFAVMDGKTSTIKETFTPPRNRKQEELVLDQLLLLKDSRIWNLENEYRIILGGIALNNIKILKPFKDKKIDIFHSSGLGYKIPYPDKEILKEVTFGVYFDKNEIEKAIELISDSNKNVKFYTASLDFENSDIVRQEIK